MNLTEVTYLSDAPTASSPMTIPLKQITLIGGCKKVEIVETIAAKARTRVILYSTNDVKIGIAYQYELAQKKGYEEIFLSFLQVEDESISRVETQHNQVLIHREREKAERLILSKSDNLTKLAIMAVTLINTKVLVINEIENGFHYIKHERLWLVIFETVGKLKAQVIATTLHHGSGIIEAFAKIALQKEYYSSSAYVEIVKLLSTGELFALEYDAEEVTTLLKEEEEIRFEAEMERFSSDRSDL